MSENNGVVLDKETPEQAKTESTGLYTLNQLMIGMAVFVVLLVGLYFLFATLIKTDHRLYEDSIESTQISLETAVEEGGISDEAVVSGNSNMALLGEGKIDGVNKFALKAPAARLDKTSDYSTIISGTVEDHEIKIIKAKTGELVATYDSEKDEITYE